MADLEKLYAALEQADAAGETQDANDIAAMIREQKALSQEPETSTMAALGHGALRGALPAAAGIISSGAGAVLGAPAGPAGAIAGGLGLGFAGSAAAAAAQEEFLKAHPELAKALGLDEETAAKEAKAHPYASMFGELGPNLLAFRPSAALLRSGKGLTEEAAKALTAQKVAAGANAALGAGVGAGVQVGQEAMGEEPIDWTKVGIAGLGGALGQKETALGRGLTRIGEMPASAASKAAVNALRRPVEITSEVPSEVAVEGAKPVAETPIPKSESQDLAAMLADVEGKAVEEEKPIVTKPVVQPEATPVQEPIVAGVEPQVKQVTPEVVAEKQQIAHPYQSELDDLYKQKSGLQKAASKDNLVAWLMKNKINPKEKADMGIEKGDKRIPVGVFNKEKGLGLDVLARAAVNDGVITEADLARYPDEVEGFRKLAYDALKGATSETTHNMENTAKLNSVLDRIEHLESIPKEQYGLKAETAEESQARIKQEAEARKAQEDAAIQADMDAQAERDRAEIARRSEKNADQFALGQTPEESLTGQQRLAGQDDDIPFDFAVDKVQGTSEQVEKAKQLANKFIKDSEVAWQEGDLGLVRTYGKKTGEVIYVPYKDGAVYQNDVKDFGDSGFKRFGFTEAEGKKMLAARDQLELEAKAKHESSPYLKFDKDVEFSPDIPESMQKVAEQWKKLLGINQKIYFTSPEHASSIKDQFTGPHRAIGGAAASRDEGGFTKTLKDGNRVIAFQQYPSTAKTLETLAHELGHAHMEQSYFSAPENVKEALLAEHRKWVKTITGKTPAKDIVTSLRARKQAKTTSMPKELEARNMAGIDDYWRTFEEWYADQTSKWATTQEKPLTIVEKFFSKLGKALRNFYNRAKNSGYLPTETFKQYMDSQVSKLELERPSTKEFQQPDTNRQTNFNFNKSSVEAITPKEPVTAKNVLGEKVGSNWKVKPNTWFQEHVIRRFQDKHIDLKRTVAEIKKNFGEIADNFNPYQKEGLWRSKAANEFKMFDEKELSPLAKKIDKLGLTTKEVSDYLHNRHAERRNNQMNKVNEITDENGNIIPWDLQDRGSGIATKDAQEYLKNLPKDKKAALEDVADDVYKIIKDTQEMLVKSGDKKQEDIDAWRRTYGDEYVPLLRDLEEEFMGSFSGQVAGKTVFDKRAMGSEKNVLDIVNSVIRQREIAIEKAAKMEVDHALYRMAIKYSNPDLYLAVSPKAIKNPDLLARELDAMGLEGKDIVGMMQERQTRSIDPLTGKVVYKTNPLERYGNNVLPIRINGEDSYIFFNKKNPVSANMVKSLRGLDTPDIGLFGQQVGKVTQWMAKVNTQWNPVFGPLNFMRDFGSAMANLSSTALKGMQKTVASGVKPAFSTIMKVMRAERSGKLLTPEQISALPEDDWTRLYYELRANGGQTLYREQLSRRANQENVINEKIKGLHSNVAKKAASGFFNYLSDFNDSIENAIRLSAFKAAKIDKKLSIDKAATIAKEITVNFDRKGVLGQQVNNYFAFFNASAQGTARMAQTLAGPAGKKIIMGGLGLGALQAGMMEMAGFGDNDPQEFIKSRNFIIPTPDGKYIAIPYPLGLHFLPNIGRLAVEAGLHGNPGKHAANMAAVVADAFNPLGGGDLSLQTITPTVLDPAVAIATNRDAFGRPISKEGHATAPTTGLSRSREQSTEINKAVAQAINYITGGTEDTKGFLSPTADQLDYLVGQATGGAGREVMKIGKTATAVATGDTENLPSYQIPLVGRFYGDTQSPAANSQHFYDNVTRMAEYEATIKGMRERKENVADFLRENPDARLWQQANNRENQISQINKQQKKMRETGKSDEQIKALDDRKQAIMTRFNDRVKALKD